MKATKNMRYQGPIVDVDIHHRPKSDDEVLRYLPKRWREYAAESGARIPLTPRFVTNGSFLSGGGKRMDSYPELGGPPGSDYPTLKQQLLDPYDYFRGVLTHDVGEQAALPNPMFATAVVRALNDWNVDTWLTRDERLCSLIALPSADPVAAAAEIRRVGDHPRIVGALIAANALGRPLGDSVYNSIYAAVTEMGLPLAVHPSPMDAVHIKFIGGAAATGIEYINQFGAQAMHYITSLLVNGVFERFPTLRITFKEFGVSWLPTLMWRLDENYKFLKLESPWMKRWPSEYVRDHIKLSTQPIEVGKDASGWAELMAGVEGVESLLCFSTDYPHFSFDDPSFIARVLPEAWHRKVFCENACGVYGWVAPPAIERGRAATAAV